MKKRRSLRWIILAVLLLLLGGIASLVPCGGFVLALGALFFAWLFLWLLYRANIFIKA